MAADETNVTLSTTNDSNSTTDTLPPQIIPGNDEDADIYNSLVSQQDPTVYEFMSLKLRFYEPSVYVPIIVAFSLLAIYTSIKICRISNSWIADMSLKHKILPQYFHALHWFLHSLAMGFITWFAMSLSVPSQGFITLGLSNMASISYFFSLYVFKSPLLAISFSSLQSAFMFIFSFFGITVHDTLLMVYIAYSIFISFGRMMFAYQSAKYHINAGTIIVDKKKSNLLTIITALEDVLDPNAYDYSTHMKQDSSKYSETENLIKRNKESFV